MTVGREQRKRAEPRQIVLGLTGVAVILAGREGPTLREEWKAHLAGESGHDPASWAKVKQAAGFVVAGVQCRRLDWAGVGWRPVDAVLRSWVLSGLFVAIPTIVDAVEVLGHEGTLAVLTSFESIFIMGAMLYGVIKVGPSGTGMSSHLSRRHAGRRRSELATGTVPVVMFLRGSELAWPRSSPEALVGEMGPEAAQRLLPRLQQLAVEAVRWSR